MRKSHILVAFVLLILSAVFTYYDLTGLPSGLAFHITSRIPWFFLVPSFFAHLIGGGGPHSGGSPEGFLLGLFLQLLVLYVAVIIIASVLGRKAGRS
jgi:hypothetical protein